jgi:putative tryptophan/tyrosine transport system substrate-binding protein
MKRREFIALIGGAVTAWPLAARAQQLNTPVIGFLHIGTADAYTVKIEYRFADNKGDRLPSLAADLVNRQVNLIVELSGGAITALAAKAATSTIPIVLAFGSDPVKLGLATSLNHPGGNVTGVTFFTTELVGKRLELLCEVVPVAQKIGYLRTGPQLSSAATEQMEADALKTTRALGRQLVIAIVDKAEDLSAAFSTLVAEHADALVVGSGPFFDNVQINDQVATLTLKNRLPAIYQYRAFAAAGGLMSYGANYDDAFQQAGIYAGRILKGEKPADLPFQQSTTVEFVINLKTAKALGLTIPYPLLGRADEVIE